MRLLELTFDYKIFMLFIPMEFSRILMIVPGEHKLKYMLKNLIGSNSGM